MEKMFNRNEFKSRILKEFEDLTKTRNIKYITEGISGYIINDRIFVSDHISGLEKNKVTIIAIENEKLIVTYFNISELDIYFTKTFEIIDDEIIIKIK